MAIPYDSPEDFGKNMPERQVAPQQTTQEDGPGIKEYQSLFTEGGSKAQPALDKAAQAASFGFFADVVNKADPGAGARIRESAHQYETENPWKSLGMDVGFGAVQTMAGPLKALGSVGEVRTVFNTAKSGAKVGAAMGGLSGAGSGGDSLTERLQRTGYGAGAGIILGGVLGGATHALQAAGTRLGEGLGLLQPATLASKTVLEHIKASGKTVDRVNKELAADPAKTLSDVVPSLRKLIKTAQNTSEDVQTQLSDALKEKLAGTASRMEGGVKRAMNSVGDMIQDIQSQFKSLELGKNADYAQAHAEKAVLTPEIRNILTNPAVKGLMTTAQETTAGMIQAGKTPKVTLKPGESPVAFLDQVQRQIGTAIDAEKDPARKVLLTELKSKMNEELAKQSPALSAGQDMSKKLASYNDAKEDAMKWGMQFAKGVNKVDMKTFSEMSDPLQKAHAQFGFLNGLNDTYLSQVGNMSTGQIQNMKTALSSDITKELLPLKYSTKINKMLDRELAFRKNAAQMSPKIERAEIAENKAVDSLAYMGNKLGAPGVGTVMKMLSKAGMSEGQASQIVKLAATEDGFATLKASGKFTDDFIAKLSAVNKMSSGLTAATLNMAGTSKSSLKDMAESK
jgi:hypothetical protein